MHILSCTDTNFVIPLGVMLHSLCVNDGGNELHFHVIIDDSVTEQQKEELRSILPPNGMMDFYLIDLENIKDYLVVKVENFPIPIYYRLLVAKILPKTIHKVLYLDADMIVRHDLSSLWNVALDDVAVAAIPNQSDCGQFWKRLDYPKKLGYFNSGVLLLSLDFIRKNSLTDVFITYIKDNPDRLLCPDQDVLNYVLRNCKVMLPVRFNAQEGFYRNPPQAVFGEPDVFEEDINNPFIVHYTKEKPWTKGCSHPLKNLYYYYKAETIWAKNNYMEKFKYKTIPISLSLRLKTLIAKAIGMIGNREEKKVIYRTIKIEQ